jgi:hypothetical protein
MMAGGRVPAAAADGDGDDGAADGNGDGDGRSAAAAASAHGRRYGRSADGGYDDGYAAAAAAGTDGEYSGHGRAATAAAAEIDSSKNMVEVNKRETHEARERGVRVYFSYFKRTGG